MGKLFVNPSEWMPLVTNRRIDFIRVPISAIGVGAPITVTVAGSEPAVPRAGRHCWVGVAGSTPGTWCVCSGRAPRTASPRADRSPTLVGQTTALTPYSVPL